MSNFVKIAFSRLSAVPEEAAGLGLETFEVAQDATISPASLAMQQAAARRVGTPEQAELARIQQNLVTRANADDQALSKAIEAANAAQIAILTEALSQDAKALSTADKKLAEGFRATKTL